MFEHLLRPLISQTIRRVTGMQRKIEAQENSSLLSQAIRIRKNRERNNRKED
jgi:hypothetical protein